MKKKIFLFKIKAAGLYSVAADTKQDIAETAWLSQDFHYVTVLTEENSKPALV